MMIGSKMHANAKCGSGLMSKKSEGPGVMVLGLGSGGVIEEEPTSEKLESLKRHKRLMMNGMSMVHDVTMGEINDMIEDEIKYLKKENNKSKRKGK